jgi:hypothetical protein
MGLFIYFSNNLDLKETEHKIIKFDNSKLFKFYYSSLIPRLKVVYNTSNLALRVVDGDEKGTKFLGV